MAENLLQFSELHLFSDCRVVQPQHEGGQPLESVKLSINQVLAPTLGETKNEKRRCSGPIDDNAAIAARTAFTSARFAALSGRRQDQHRSNPFPPEQLHRIALRHRYLPCAQSGRTICSRKSASRSSLHSYV
jgi:hypothetical protein